MGTVPLLLRMRADRNGLPDLSPLVGDFVRTNSESLIAVVSPTRGDLSEGVAITSILHTDQDSHIEPVRYASGSGFFRLLALPHAPGSTVVARLAGALRSFVTHPWRWLHALMVNDFAAHTQVLLYMRTLEGCLSLRLGRSLFTGYRRGLVTTLDRAAQAPLAFMPEATDLAKRFAEKVGGVPVSLLSETLLGTPSTAHVLGGACMGSNPEEGVIDIQHPSSTTRGSTSSTARACPRTPA